MRLAIVILIAVSLAACSSAPSGRWVKTDYSDQQRKADQFDCEYKATQMNQDSNDIIRGIGYMQTFNRCMDSKGYHWEKF